MDIYAFGQMKQDHGEALQNCYRRLRERAILCEFPHEDDEIKTQIIHHISDSRIRDKALREPMDLKAILDHGFFSRKF